jgi:hypothetical protein
VLVDPDSQTLDGIARCCETWYFLTPRPSAKTQPAASSNGASVGTSQDFLFLIMNPFTVAVIVLACVFGGAFAGQFLRNRLPGHHLQEDSKDIVKLGIGVVATMAALVLGLLVSSAKSSFDKMSDELTMEAARVVQLDRALAQYGPDAKEVRSALRQNFQAVVDALDGPDESQLAKVHETKGEVEQIQAAIRALVPRSDAQRELRSEALAFAGDASAYRWLLLLQQHDSIPGALLVVVVLWLTLIFFGFGLFSPRNRTVMAALFLCALSVSVAIFLIMEMDHPLKGMVRISDAPMRTALSILTGN